MANYTDTQVANIIEKYVSLMRAREFYFNNIYGKETETNFSRKLIAIEHIEKYISEIKKVTSIELRQIFPEISLGGIEELCKQAKKI